MTPAQQQLAERIFKEARQLPAAAREGYIVGQAAGDRTVIVEVKSLLGFADETQGVLDGHASSLAGIKIPAPGRGDESPLPPNGTVGRYRILSVLGTGGMGVVYLAEQDRPKRTVALKVIRPELGSPAVLKRFEYEAEALGRLQHPGIAQIIEAGAAETGFGVRPFFAMEYVEGRPLCENSREQSLSAADRLRLMLLVCDAVEHAHQRGVIHRDLKPANILVDRTGHPKILDFGVARIAESGPEAHRLTIHRTGERQLIGTLAYMSPEQVVGGPHDVDTRSDVYALGVILYEILSGKLPHDLASRPLPDAVRVIRDDDPPSLSTTSSLYRGDLDTIVCKAMEKAKERRYQSAADLAADIRRYLNHEPIAARPASTLYQLTKFVRRNRALVGGAALALVALMAGLIVSLWQAKAARQAAVESQQVASVLKNIFAGINPVIAQARDTSLLKGILDDSASRLGKSLAQQPRAQADLRVVVGDAYFSIGAYDESDAQYRRAMALFGETDGPSSRQVAVCLIKLVGSLINQTKHEEAAAAARHALEIVRGSRVSSSVERADATAALGSALRFIDPPQSVQCLEEAVAIYDSLAVVPELDIAKAMTHLAPAYMESGKLNEAESSIRRALEIRERLLGPDHFDTIEVVGLLGDTLLAWQRYADAEPYQRRFAENRERMLRWSGAEVPHVHPSVALAWAALASSVQKQGRYDEALSMYLAQVEPMRRWGDELNLGTLHNNIASAYTDLGRFDEADAEYEEALRLYRRNLGEDDSMRVVIALLGQANVRMLKHDHAAAESTARKALDIAVRSLPEGHHVRARAAVRLSGALAAQALESPRGAVSAARADEASVLAELGASQLAAALGPEHPATTVARCRGVIARVARAACAARQQEPGAARLLHESGASLEATRALYSKNPPPGVPPSDAKYLQVELAAAASVFYDTWESFEPDRGYSTRAAASRDELARLTTFPITR